jgi:hypothetical protein
MAMTLKKKFVLILGTTCLLGLLFILGSGLYLFYHPERIKPIIERALSAYTDSACSIESLSYSFQPASIEAKNIRFKPRKQQDTFSMEIRLVKSSLGLDGSFGQKSLVLKNVQINGFDIDLFSGPQAFATFSKAEKQKPSFLSNLNRRFLSLFLFKQIRFDSGKITDGRVSSIIGARTIKVESIRAKAGRDKPIFLSFAIDINDSALKTRFKAPAVNIKTDSVFNLIEHKLNGTLQSGRMTFQNPDIGIGKMDIFARFGYTYPDKKLTLEKLRLNADTIAVSADMAKMDFLPVSVTGAKTITLETGPSTYAIDKGEIDATYLSLTIGDLLLKKTAAKLPSPLHLQFKAKANFKLPERQVKLTRFHLDFADILNLKGDFQAAPGSKDAIRLNLSDASISPQKSVYFLPPPLKQSLKSFTLDGLVSVRGELWGKKENHKWLWECDFTSQLKNNPFTFVNQKTRLNGSASANISAKGFFPDVVITAQIQVDSNVLMPPTLELKPSKLDFFVLVRYPNIDIKNVAALIPWAKFDLNSRNILLKDIRIRIPKASIDIEKKSAIISESGFDVAGLKNLSISGSLKEKVTTLLVNGRETGFFSWAESKQMLPPGWIFKARDTFQIKAAQKKSGTWNVQSRLSLANLVFQNKDESIMGENISLKLDLDGDLDLKHSALSLAASLNVGEGEALFDRYYLNLKTNPLRTRARGVYHIQKKYLQLSKLSLALVDILPLEIEGRFDRNLSSGLTDFTVRIEPSPLKPIFQHLLKDPFKTEKPLLETLETDGTISANLRIKKHPNSWQATGRLGWQKGKLALSQKNISLKGIHLDLPVWFQSALGKAPAKTLKGRLSVDSVAVPMLPEQPLRIAMDIGPNRMFVKSSTKIKTPGGDLGLGPVEVDGLYGPEPAIKTSLWFDAIKLQPFLSKIWPHPLPGSLSGRLDPLRYKSHTITSQGELSARVFGGRVVCSGLGASGISTSVPVFKLDIKGDNLLLADMTTDTSFGTIDGVLGGYIRNIQIAYGQPQRFNLLLETVKQKGVSQKISVKAIDNIARIGGGQSPFMGLAGVVASFFKKFPYRKIGIQADLENDLFTINGTIKEGATEYLVKRGRFSGVNVINQNPSNRASFKDMVKRIKRIAQQGGPVVK